MLTDAENLSRYLMPVLVMMTIGGACHPAISAAPHETPIVAVRETQGLRSPFDVEARRALIGRPMPEPRPLSAAPPMRDLAGVSFYVDADKSIVDPDLKAENAAALRPLRDAVLQIVKLADGWMVSRPPNRAYAAYALEGLSRWADADALLGTVNHQGEYEREWTLGSLALAYLKIRDTNEVDDHERTAIERWFRRLAVEVMPYYERPGLRSNANNHAYWAGMAVAAVGVSIGERSLFDWGLARARIGIAQIQSDGVLPLERDRRTLALHYHVFALAPLVMLAEMARANGLRLYDEGDHAISRLANRVIAGLADPTSFAALAGVAQEIRLPPPKTDLAWAEAYAQWFPDAHLSGWVRAARPLFDVRLGGDMTAAFGAAEP